MPSRPGTSRAWGLPLLAGRRFRAILRIPSAPPQAIVNEEFVRRVRSRPDPLAGASLRRGRVRGIGVVPNSLYNAFGEPADADHLLSWRDRPFAIGEIHLRARAVPEPRSRPRFVGSPRSGSELPHYDCGTLSDHIEANLIFRRIPRRMFMVLWPVAVAGSRRSASTRWWRIPCRCARPKSACGWHYGAGRAQEAHSAMVVPSSTGWWSWGARFVGLALAFFAVVVAIFSAADRPGGLHRRAGRAVAGRPSSRPWWHLHGRVPRVEIRSLPCASNKRRANSELFLDRLRRRATLAKSAPSDGRWSAESPPPNSARQQMPRVLASAACVSTVGGLGKTHRPRPGTRRGATRGSRREIEVVAPARSRYRRCGPVARPSPCCQWSP
jgi:hypothetical protein